MEEWKDVVGYEGHYIVSNLGRVKNVFFRGKVRNQILKGYNNKVTLGTTTKRKKYCIDMIVAKAFLPKAELMEVVEHINGNPKDNRAENLRWSNITWKEKVIKTNRQNAKFLQNEWHEEQDYIVFKLTNCEKYGICDKNTWEKVKDYRWHITPMGYIASHVDGHYVKFHNFVLPPKEGFIADHIDRNRLDNRASNLRYATKRANSINHSLSKRNKTGHTGVRKTKDGRYEAYIWSGKQIGLGRYKTFEEAVLAREEAEEKYFKPIIEKETHT